MKFCKNCGKELDDAAVVCPGCGVSQTGNSDAVPVDRGGFLWGLLGFCIPIVGLVLFLVWRDSKPKTAKAAGIGALVSVGCLVLYYVIIVGLGAVFMSL